ncbi:MAG: hypothetical protein Kow0049_16420 [Stanieria sp.]
MRLPYRVQRLFAAISGETYKIFIRFLPTPKILPKPELELTFVSMCGVKHLDYLQQCLLPLYMSWSSLPKIQIVSDGTVSLSQLKLLFSWWPVT